MIQEITVPEVGESITEGEIVEWHQESGALVKEGDPLFELETDKVTMTVQAQHSGRLAIRAEEGTTVQVGQVVGTIETDAGAGEGAAQAAEGEGADEGEGGGEGEGEGEGEAPERQPVSHEGLSPAVRRMVDEHGLDPGQIAGSGRDGRITKADVVRHLEREQQPREEEAPAAPARRERPPEPPAPERRAGGSRPRGPAPAPRAGARQSRQPMSRIRRRIAERLVEAQQTAAILTTFNEADMSAVMVWRARHKAAFQDAHGVKLGLMSFFVKAAVEALKAVPAVNAFIEGDDIVHNHTCDIGVAVGTEHGLVVPVIRDADRLSFHEIEAAIVDFARRAKDRQLELSELSGGTFTISNGGVYGSMLSTPILNPPQSGILGLHSIKRRPVVVDDDDRVEVRPMMYLALSYDHRLVDGQEAVTFLRRVVACIEQPERMLLGI